MGNIGSHVDLTSGRPGHQAKLAMGRELKLGPFRFAGAKGISRQESGAVVNFTVWVFESLAPGDPFTSRRMDQFVRHPPHGSPVPGANQASVFSMIR
jgi:hypothetical protein